MTQACTSGRQPPDNAILSKRQGYGVFLRAVRSKFQRHRALSATVVFVLFWLVGTAAFYLAVGLFAQSGLVWLLRPYIWAFLAYSLIVFAAGGLVVSLFLACWTWLDPGKEKHRIWRSHLTRGACAVVVVTLLGLAVGLAINPVNEPHLLLQSFFGRRDFHSLSGKAFYLARAELSGIDLSEADLSGADLGGATLNKADLQDANLSDAHLCGADLAGANLVGADLRDVDLTFADLTGANLAGVDLRTTDLAGAELIDANLCGANLVGTNLNFASLKGARMDDDTQMDEGGRLLWELTNQDNAQRELHSINLHGADLAGASLAGADLEASVLTLANLDNAHLQGANLRGANLAKARLRGADLGSANLREASLQEADLQGANLSRADLSKANLTQANLSGVDLRGANLLNALVTDEQLAQARWLEGAILPDGTTNE